MHARSALFDVYGDLLPRRDHRATVASLVRLLEPVGIKAPAVRTAVSRMVAQGWLTPVRLPDGRGYAATEQAVRRFAEASDRVYRRRTGPWDGRWHVLWLGADAAAETDGGEVAPLSRTTRARVQRELRYLGYAPWQGRCWISPRVSPEVADVLDRCGVRAVTARAVDLEPAGAAVGAWDLESLDAAYRSWLDRARSIVRRDDDPGPEPERAAYATRFALVHEWRKFLFTDPGLPAELLPEDWAGREAEEFFVAEATRLQAPAERFVARALT